MVESRLIRRLRELNLDNYASYLKFLKNNHEEKVNFINALTTNLTDFFRERAHFDYLKQTVFPDIRQRNNNKTIRVWSAASSTGEEIYSLGFTLHEAFGNTDWDYKILGTDVDTNVLEKAKNAVYKKDILKNISPQMVANYIQSGKGYNADKVKIKKCICENVKFRKFNLLKDSLPTNIQFDFIFLRNVLIYFDKDAIETAINTVYRYLKPGGHLFIGHSETLNSIQHQFKTISSSIYIKK